MGTSPHPADYHAVVLRPRWVMTFDVVKGLTCAELVVRTAEAVRGFGTGFGSHRIAGDTPQRSKGFTQVKPVPLDEGLSP